MPRATLNLGILAHVDAGKTTLTERLLYRAGVIDEPGSVDKGTTQTDSLTLERQRGITIKSAVASFTVEGTAGGTAVNLIDTPGHPDFIAEVDRALSVLDGVVLVISAVEGVQPQTRILWRALRRAGLPALLFVNKIDRRGADCERVLDDIAARLTQQIVPLGWVSQLGTRAAAFNPFGGVNQVARTHGYKVYFGSASTGAGVDALLEGLASLLPTAAGDADGPVSGRVFKIERGAAGEKVAYARLFSGTIAVRDAVPYGPGGQEHDGKVTAISVFADGTAQPGAKLTGGQIARLSGLTDVQVGDVIGTSPDGEGRHHFPPPTLETAVVPRDPRDRPRLHTALTQLAEADPLINVRQDDGRQELYLSLYGEVQKQVIEATLAAEYGLEAGFRDTTPICVERPVRSGYAEEILHAPSNPYNATLGLRVDPAPPGSGIRFRLAVTHDSVPLYVYKNMEGFAAAMEQHVTAALQHGPRGWRVTDCVVTLARSGYSIADGPPSLRGPDSGPQDFRKLTPLVVAAALRRTGTVVCEPVHRFRVEAPADTLGVLLPAMAKLRAVPTEPAAGDTVVVLEGDVPATQVHALRQQLPPLTRGEGVLEAVFDRYEPRRGGSARRNRD